MSQPFTILLVEDNPDDARLIREALASGRLLHEMVVTEDGKAALNFLNKVAPFESARSPDLILLDLNPPGMDGRQLLADIKSNPKWAHIPVLVLTCSQSEEDVLKTYNLHANGFIAKPPNCDEFMEFIRKTGEFWSPLPPCRQKT